MPQSTKNAASDDTQLLAALLLVVGVVLAYVPAMFGGFVWDDDAYVSQNMTLRSAAGLAAIWFEVLATPQYYPLVHTSYWIEYRFWGLNPTGYHVTNILLHAVNAVLLWRVLRFIGVTGAWLAAALFALHPVHVESVAWITERKNVLSGLFYLASGLCYLHCAGVSSLKSPAVADASGSLFQRRSSLFGVSLLLFVCALLSKTVTATLPGALALVLWWRRGLTRRDWVTLAPMFVLGAVFGLHTAWLEREHVGARGFDFDYSMLERCLIAGRIVWFYLWSLLWPVNLIFMYPRWQIDATVWWQYLFPLAALALLVVLWVWRKRLGVGPLVAALFFGGTLFPVLGFANVYPMRFSFVADHFQYLASIGPLTLAAAGAVWLFQRGRLPFYAQASAVLVVLGLLGMLTWSQCQNYFSLETLWRDTVRKNPRAFLAQVALGRIHQQNAAIAIELGDAAATAFELELAEQHYQAAIAANPRFWEAYYGLGIVQQGQNRFAEASASLRRAIAIEPNFLDHRDALGHLYLTVRKFDEAQEQFDAILTLHPESGSAHGGLATALAAQGQLEAALWHLQEALRIEIDRVSARESLQ